jgi:murein DD-endopeptidase MepM/ murein hydrolase activator NlpD
MTEQPRPEGETRQNSGFLATLREMGLSENITRIGTHVITVVLIVIAVIAMGRFYVSMQANNEVNLQATAQALAAPTISAITGLSPEEAAMQALMPDFNMTGAGGAYGIRRAAEPLTIIPNRPRVDVDTYVVQQGESVFSIAEQFGLKPETILWGNYEVLQDNPRALSVGQELKIMPTDGVYYRYNVGESLRSIAEFFGVAPETILEWPGNDLDPYDTNIDDPGIADGSWLIIPDGERELQDWGPPAITRDNPAVASYYGAGACGAVYEGPIGNGTFAWPTPSRQISGYSYDSAVHPGLDIGGAEGNAIYATDSGVVVYAGWSDYGYGYLIVLDHGNGWQSAYAHLSGIGVFCGQGVTQGTTIGALGNTGNSTGAHLHFEMNSAIYGKVNPINFLIP